MPCTSLSLAIGRKMRPSGFSRRSISQGPRNQSSSCGIYKILKVNSTKTLWNYRPLQTLNMTRRVLKIQKEGFPSIAWALMSRPVLIRVHRSLEWQRLYLKSSLCWLLSVPPWQHPLNPKAIIPNSIRSRRPWLKGSQSSSTKPLELSCTG